MDISRLVRQGISLLQSAEIPYPQREAEELLAFTLKINRIELLLNPEKYSSAISSELINTFNSLIQRRANQEPLAYLLESIPFYNIHLHVTPNVLIPRPETEWIVDQILSHYPDSSTKLQVWDLCTGSGAIGLALKQMRPQWQVILSDLSSEALEVARQNGKNNFLDVELLQGDLFEPFQGRQADLIVINPPYIPSEEIPALEKSVVAYEPHLALDGGVDGLDYYRRIASRFSEHLKPGGTLWLELGAGQGKEVAEIFYKAGFSEISVRNDLSGHDRLFFLEKQHDIGYP